ncbi:MAG TPA: hypothetical protein VFQ35_26470, partial [Polyangiaceae bacterium]|nr:hypothetical protein [Polyangiaceae bacterium]
YIPVLFCFLAFWQLGELLVAQMVVARASSAAGRAAVVVLPDDPAFYSGEAKGSLGGIREGSVRMAAGMILAASPHLAEEFYVNLSNPPEEVDAIHATVTATFRCNRLRFVCGADGLVHLSATSSHAYHGAKYEYAPTDLSNVTSSNTSTSTDASCFDGGPSKNGSGGKGGNDTGNGGRSGTGGRDSSNGSGGRSATGGADGGCPPGQSKNPDGSCSSTRGGPDGSCKPGYVENPDGTCSSAECAKIKDPKRRKTCDVNGPCPNPNDERDEVGECCKALKTVTLSDGSKAKRCNEEKLACTNQESATGDSGHKLTGHIIADDTVLSLPEIEPKFTEICGDKTSCSATSNGDFVKDIGVKIVANMKLKEKAVWCPKDPSGKRKAEIEEIKQEWNDWVKTYKEQVIDEYLQANPGAKRKDAESKAWKAKKAEADKIRADNVKSGTRPRAGQSGVKSYPGPDPALGDFFSALDSWCSELEKVGDKGPYEKYLAPNVKAAEDRMLAAYSSLPSTIEQSIDTSLQLQSGINHTERKVIELLEGWANKGGKDLKSMKLRMDLEGDWSPCASCTRALQEFVATYGGSVSYCWTKGIYLSGIARTKEFVVAGGSLMAGTIRHKGCVTITPTGTNFAGERLCDKGETRGVPSAAKK